MFILTFASFFFVSFSFPQIPPTLCMPPPPRPVPQFWSVQAEDAQQEAVWPKPAATPAAAAPAAARPAPAKPTTAVTPPPATAAAAPAPKVRFVAWKRAACKLGGSGKREMCNGLITAPQIKLYGIFNVLLFRKKILWLKLSASECTLGTSLSGYHFQLMSCSFRLSHIVPFGTSKQHGLPLTSANRSPAGSYCPSSGEVLGHPGSPCHCPQRGAQAGATGPAADPPAAAGLLAAESDRIALGIAVFSTTPN